MNTRIWIQWADDKIILETWDDYYELETVLTVDEARVLANGLNDAIRSLNV